MENNIDHSELVRQAQLGNKDCLNILAKATRQRLYSYVYRYTLVNDLSHDIVQETILKMLETLTDLRNTEQFWPWIYKIALNKIHLHHRNLKRDNNFNNFTAKQSSNQNDQQVIENLVYQEFKEAVLAAMQELKPSYRSIINMRCYDQMPYAQIAKVLDCNEFSAQKLFFRAKNSLKKKLIRHGLGKGSMLMALVFFGKLTAPDEVAAANLIVTSSSIKVSSAASLAASLGTKKAIVSLTAAALVTSATLVTTSHILQTPVEKPAINPFSKVFTSQQASQMQSEYWYYYPSKDPSTVMMRMESTEDIEHQCVFLQNADKNYYYDKDNNIVYLNNSRIWHQDLSVWRLPTDSLTLTSFLAKFDGKIRLSDNVYKAQAGMLLVVQDNNKQNKHQLTVNHHYNVLGEDYFKYDWPANVTFVDNRDLMHKRGWTYFNVIGYFNGKEVVGRGALPFFYSKYSSHSPWMQFNIGSNVFIDETFFGFSRQWQGLHTLDTIRRDAAEKQIPFKTKLNDDGNTQVTLTMQNQTVTYTINMQKDLIEQISFDGQNSGTMAFKYLYRVDNVKFPQPQKDAKNFSFFDL